MFVLAFGCSSPDTIKSRLLLLLDCSPVLLGIVVALLDTIASCTSLYVRLYVWVGWLPPARAPKCRLPRASLKSVKCIVYVFPPPVTRLRTQRLVGITCSPSAAAARLFCLVFVPSRPPAMHPWRSALGLCTSVLRTPVGAQSQEHGAGGHLLVQERLERGLACATRPEPRVVTHGESHSTHTQRCAG